MTQLTESATECIKNASVALRSEWEYIVDLAFSLDKEMVEPISRGLAGAAKVGPDSIRRKLDAVKYAASLGHPIEDIKAMGQEVVLGTFVKSKRVKQYGNEVRMTWVVPGSLRELVHQDQDRIMGILDLVAPVDWWDWLHGLLSHMTDEEIRASSGEDNEGPNKR